MAHKGVDGKKFQPDLETELVFELVAGDTMYVGLLVIAVLGFVFSLVLDEIERMLIPWKANA
jgi:ABC-type nitrate/sulfonate/bicarbonate transport system permease component